MHCKDVKNAFFNDTSDEVTNKWLPALKPMPSEGWVRKITYAGWKEVPSVYLLCKKDALLPEALQRQFAGLAGSKVVECNAGHMVQLSQPETVVELIKNAASGKV